MVDSNGQIVRSQYTDNAQAAVLSEHRLLPDSTPIPDVDFDPQVQTFRRLVPVPPDAIAIAYEFILLTEIPSTNEIEILEE
jgi:hypothetical protein